MGLLYKSTPEDVSQADHARTHLFDPWWTRPCSLLTTMADKQTLFSSLSLPLGHLMWLVRVETHALPPIHPLVLKGLSRLYPFYALTTKPIIFIPKVHVSVLTGCFIRLDTCTLSTCRPTRKNFYEGSASDYSSKQTQLGWPLAAVRITGLPWNLIYLLTALWPALSRSALMPLIRKNPILKQFYA